MLQGQARGWKELLRDEGVRIDAGLKKRYSFEMILGGIVRVDAVGQLKLIQISQGGLCKNSEYRNKMVNKS